MSNTVAEYGIITLPILMMMLFGLFGHRPGQIRNKFISFSLNLLCFINYLIILVVVVWYLRAILINYQHVDFVMIFFAGFCTLVVGYSIFLLFIFYKNYNLFCLLQDAKNLQKGCVRKIHLVYVWIMFLLIIINFSATICILLDRIIVPAFTGSNPILNGLVMLVELLLYSIVTYSLIVATSFMVVVLSIMMANEFDRCSEDFDNFMKKADKLSVEELSKMTDKFYDLTLLVDKMDAMFSLPVGLTLAASLGTLCMTVYKTVTFGLDVTTSLGSLDVSGSALALMILLPSLTLLNSKVNTCKSHEKSQNFERQHSSNAMFFSLINNINDIINKLSSTNFQ